MSSYEAKCFENLAKAIIMQAYQDAIGKKDNYNRKTARNFLMAINNVWFCSLKSWCEIAGIDHCKIIKESRKMFGAK